MTGRDKNLKEMECQKFDYVNPLVANYNCRITRSINHSTSRQT